MITMITQKRKTGDFGERAAARYLQKKHYRIIARNYKAGHLELDIVAVNKAFIVFVEVKTRTVASEDDEMRYGTPASAVDRDKKRNTIDAAYAYLRDNPSALQPRIDVIEVYLDKNKDKPKILKINHFENAVTRNNI